MTWLPDNTGNLYKDGNTSWRLRFDATDIKTDKPYNVKIASWLVNRLEAYIEEYRNTLLESRHSNYLFVSSQVSKAVKWESLDRHIQKLTKNLVPESPGFGAHAFRHLVATDWLTKNPNDFLTVAELLNDRIETVIAHYAHLKKDQSFDRYENYVVGVMGDNLSK
jgi:site-specific recombinase XerD